MPNLTPHVRLVDGTPVTSSRDIAEFFSRNHRDVIRKIESLDCSDHFLTANFYAVPYQHNGNTYTEYQITRDGFTFLAMGFTGKRAAQFKEAYILRFNELEQQAHTPTLNHTLADADKYQLLNTMIRSMGFTSAPVVVPSMEMITLIESVRHLQRQLERLTTNPQNVNQTIERLKLLADRNFLDEGV